MTFTLVTLTLTLLGMVGGAYFGMWLENRRNRNGSPAGRV